MNRNRAALPNGVTLPYAEQGDRAGIPMLMLHGYSDSWTSYSRLFEHLPRRFRAIAVTLRGHGDASRPERGYHPRDFAADLAAFMDALGIASAVIVGHSMGSLVAQRFAIDHPGRVRGLALLGAFATLRGTATADELEAAVAGMGDAPDPAFARAFQLSTLANPVPPDFLDMAVAESLKLPVRVWREVLTGMIEEDVAGELGRIAAPTLLLWGNRDANFPERGAQDALAAGIRNARLIVYPGAGHALHWEDPARVAADLAAFAGDCAR